MSDDTDTPEGKDPNEAPQKPVKRRGGKRRSQREQTHPPTMNNVRNLFGDDANVGTQGSVEIPPSGTKDYSIDSRPRRKVKVEKQINLGKRWAQVFTAVENGEYTWEEFCSSLTPAELARGQLMDKNGHFTGRPPTMVPRAFLNACTKELMKRGATLWKENYVEAIQAMTSIAKDPSAKHSDRIKAAEFVIERLEGKTPQVVQVTVEEPWQVALDGMIAETNEEMAISRAHDYTAREAALRQTEDHD